MRHKRKALEVEDKATSAGDIHVGERRLKVKWGRQEGKEDDTEEWKWDRETFSAQNQRCTEGETFKTLQSTNTFLKGPCKDFIFVVEQKSCKDSKKVKKA